MSTDEKWMQYALKWAVRGRGKVHPNPMVGAVVVRAGKLTGEGYHESFGGAHAEVNALKQAGARARGATLYLNLEPCSHWGKTPPCVDSILRAGVRTVFAAMKDPNPAVSGKGFAALRRAGVQVRVGLLRSEAEMLNRAFSTAMVRRRPFVTLKAAMSLDGKSALAGGESRWITDVPAREWGYSVRAEIDAIAVGVGTVLADNPTLTSHGKGRNPLRTVFDSRLRTPPRSKIFSGDTETILFCDSGVSLARRQKFGKATVISVSRSTSGLRIQEALRMLHERGVTHLLVEGGGSLADAFLQADCVDEVLWFIAPKIIGGASAPTPVAGMGVRKLSKAWRVEEWQVEPIGPDLCIRGRIKHKD